MSQETARLEQAIGDGRLVRFVNRGEGPDAISDGPLGCGRTKSCGGKVTSSWIGRETDLRRVVWSSAFSAVLIASAAARSARARSFTKTATASGEAALDGGAEGDHDRSTSRTGQLEEIDEVEVSADRESIDDPSANVTVLTREQLSLGRARGDDVALLLERVAGARVLDLGGPLAERKLSLRGGSASQSLIVVDEVPQTSPFASGADVGSLSLESLESMEVVRGGAGAVLGDGALAGALLITTKRPTDVLQESLSLAYGAFGTTRVTARASRHPLAVTASFERSDGAFRYVSDLRGLPDVEGTRRNNDGHRGAFSVRYEDTLGAAKVFASSGGYLRESGVPGPETQEHLEARERSGALDARVLVRVRPFSESDAPELAIGATAHFLDIDYSDRDVFAFELRSSSTRFLVIGGDAAISTSIAESHFVTARASLASEQSDSTEHGTPSRFRAGGVLSDEVHAGDVAAFGALRLETLTDQRIAVLPRFGLRYEPPSRSWGLRAALGRSWRSPAVDEIYHPSEAGFAGNPSLRAEAAWEVESSVFVGPPEGPRATLALFGRVVSNAILYLQTNAFVVRPENVGAARLAGMELELTWTPRLGAGASASLAWTSSVLVSELAVTGRSLPTQPSASSGAEVALLVPPFTASTALRFIGETTANIQGTIRVSPYLRWDAALAVSLFEGGSTAISFSNLLDDRTLESVHKIPLPGRAILASIRVSTDAGLSP